MNTEHLATAGPTHPVHGFPLWFGDSNQLRLELVLEPDRQAPALEDRPRPTKPLQFPDNFPGEAFYFLAEARLSVAATGQPGGRARVTMALEAAFGGAGEPAPGQQITFARVRVRMDGVNPGDSYKVVHPYGVIERCEADGRGRVDYTEDLGIAEGDPTRVLVSGKVAPFLLSRSYATGDRYIGNGVTPEKIQPGPHREGNDAVDYVEIIGPQVRNGSATTQDPDRVRTDLFTLQGRLAGETGLWLKEATYRRADDGTVSLTVKADSLPGQDLRLSADGIHIRLREDSGHYVGLTATNAVPLNATLFNATDDQGTGFPVRFDAALEVTDVLHDLDSQILSFRARLSDPELTIRIPALNYSSTIGQIRRDDYSEIPIPNPTGVPATLDFHTVQPGTPEPLQIISRAVRTIGTVDANLPIEAIIRPVDTSPYSGDPLTLDGSPSKGAASYQWSVQPSSGVTLQTPNARTCVFTATNAGSYQVTLKVSDFTGNAASDDIAVSVLTPTKPDKITISRCEYLTLKRQYLLRGILESDHPSTVIRAELGGANLLIATIDAPNGEWEIRKTLDSSEANLVPGNVGRELRVKARESEATSILLIRS